MGKEKFSLDKNRLQADDTKQEQLQKLTWKTIPGDLSDLFKKETYTKNREVIHNIIDEIKKNGAENGAENDTGTTILIQQRNESNPTDTIRLEKNINKWTSWTPFYILYINEKKIWLRGKNDSISWDHFDLEPFLYWTYKDFQIVEVIEWLEGREFTEQLKQDTFYLDKVANQLSSYIGKLAKSRYTLNDVTFHGHNIFYDKQTWKPRLIEMWSIIKNQMQYSLRESLMHIIVKSLLSFWWWSNEAYKKLCFQVLWKLFEKIDDTQPFTIKPRVITTDHIGYTNFYQYVARMTNWFNQADRQLYYGPHQTQTLNPELIQSVKTNDYQTFLDITNTWDIIKKTTPETMNDIVFL